MMRQDPLPLLGRRPPLPFHLLKWHNRIEHLPVILDALKVPSQDLVTRIKNDPELEARITKAMAERRAVGKKDRGENQDQ